MPDERPVILLTRPKRQSERFADLCKQALGVEQQILQSPLLKIEVLAMPVLDARYRGLIFTSENGVLAYSKSNTGANMPAYCVGARTAKAARKLGLDARSANGSADDLIQMIQMIQDHGPLLHIRGEHARGNISERLGAAVSEMVGYRQTALPLSEAATEVLAGQKMVILPVFSPRTAQLLCDTNKNIVAPIMVVAISAAVKEAVLGSGLTARMDICVSNTPDAEGMLQAIQRCIAA